MQYRYHYLKDYSSPCQLQAIYRTKLILHSVAARSVDGELHGAESDSGLPTRSTARKFYFKGYEGWVAGGRARGGGHPRSEAAKARLSGSRARRALPPPPPPPSPARARAGGKLCRLFYTTYQDFSNFTSYMLLLNYFHNKKE